MFAHQNIVLDVVGGTEAQIVRDSVGTPNSPKPLLAVDGLYEVRRHFRVVAGQRFCK